MKVLHVINSLATGGAEKLILDSLPIFNNKLKTNLFLLDAKNTPFLKQLKSNKKIVVYPSFKVSIYNPLHIIKLIKLLRNYDIVHVHLFPAQYWVAVAKLLSFSRVKLVFTEHCTTNSRMDNFFLRKINKFIYFMIEQFVLRMKFIIFTVAIQV